MIDNGLLRKGYHDLSNKDGYLQLKYLVKSRQLDKLEKLDIQKLDKLYGDKDFSSMGSFYVKFPKDSFIFSDTKIESEVVLSQIAYEMGFYSAIYFPCITPNGKKGVISNDISKVCSKTMLDYLLYNEKVISDYKMPYRSKEEYSSKELELEKFFTDKAFTDLIKLGYFDVYSRNVDRHTNNILVETKLSLSSPSFLQVNNIGLIDFSLGGDFTQSIENKTFVNGLGGKVYISGNELIDFLKNDEVLLSYVNPNEMAEQFGNYDVTRLIDDIKDQTNFSVSNEFSEGLKKSFYDISEELIK